MKKVIALALALVMVCTMAMAVTPNFVDKTGAGAYDAPTGTYPQLKPGEVLYFDVDDLDGTTGPYINDKNEFVPANNKVTVTYGKGADLVKSAGWVLTGDGNKTNLSNWQYQIVLKDNDSAICDTKTCDFSITKVEFKATGEKAVTHIFDGDDTLPGNHYTKYEMDYGWTTVEYILNANGVATDLPTKDVLTTIVATQDAQGKAVTENKKTVNATVFNCASEYVLKLVAAQKVLVKAPVALNTTKLAAANGYDTNLEWVKYENPTNLTGSVTVTNWLNTLNVYNVDAAGKVTKAAVTVDDGVASFVVPAYSTTVLYAGTLRNVTAAAGTTETGTTTNPGTGANDVVGVAAALAVVALVSGAAISLKK